jgi:hypothetical protein
MLFIEPKNFPVFESIAAALDDISSPPKELANPALRSKITVRLCFA